MVTTEARRGASLRSSAVVFAAGPLAGCALPWLQRAGLIASTSLWILFGLLVACSASNVFAQSVARRLCEVPALHVRSAVAAFSTAWFVYACGWGSLTVIAYAIGIADTMRVYGSRAWRPGVCWSALAIASGELAIALGIAPSMLRPSVGHCAAATTFGCLLILARTLGTSAEATEKATAEVEAGRTYFRDLVQHAADVIALVNPALCVEYVSPGIVDLAGRDASWCVGRSIAEILGPDAGADICRAYDNLTLADYLSCEWLLTNEVRENRRVLARLTRRPDGSLVLNLRDVTEQRALEERLQRRARVDDLTGLPNRTALIDTLRGMSLANVTVLFIDLDGFKEVNDTLGHEQGDAVLRCVANTIAAAVPAGVDVGRLGGDEFLAITRMTAVPEIEDMAAQIISSIEGVGTMTGHALSASVGIARAADDGELPERLVRRADQAMYAAKKRGPGLVVTDEWVERRESERA